VISTVEAIPCLVRGAMIDVIILNHVLRLATMTVPAIIATKGPARHAQNLLTVIMAIHAQLESANTLDKYTNYQDSTEKMALEERPPIAYFIFPGLSTFSQASQSPTCLPIDSGFRYSCG